MQYSFLFFNLVICSCLIFGLLPDYSGSQKAIFSFSSPTSVLRKLSKGFSAASILTKLSGQLFFSISPPGVVDITQCLYIYSWHCFKYRAICMPCFLNINDSSSSLTLLDPGGGTNCPDTFHIAIAVSF